MEMNRLTREADELIRKVVARYNSLYSPAGGISQVELDLLLDDLRLMYEKFKTIGQLNLMHLEQEHRKVSMPAATREENKKEPVAKEPAESELKAEHAPAASQEIPAEPVQQEMSETEPRIPVEPEAETADSYQVAAETTDVSTSEIIREEPATTAPSPAWSDAGSRPAANTEPVSAREESVQTIADKYKNSQKSLGEIMSGGSGDASLGSRLGHQQITDLKSVIGIAEKFSFINELFGGDPLAYEKAIVQLNGASRLAEAEAYLGTLRLNHKWPVESTAAVLLTDIIRRRFGA